MLFGKKEGKLEKKESTPLFEEVAPVDNMKKVAERVYLLTPPDISVCGVENVIKRKLLGKEVRVGEAVKINFDDSLLKDFGYNVLEFKVWRIDPESPAVVAENTKIIITKHPSEADLGVVKDKVLGALAILEEEVSRPLGYVELKQGFSLESINYVEENCIKVLKEHYGSFAGYLAVIVLDGLKKLKK